VAAKKKNRKNTVSKTGKNKPGAGARRGSRISIYRVRDGTIIHRGGFHEGEKRSSSWIRQGLVRERRMKKKPVAKVAPGRRARM